MFFAKAIFYTICLFIGNVHYELSFSMVPAMLLWFCWMQFWWCGFVCVSVLTDVNQVAKDQDKKRSCLK